MQVYVIRDDDGCILSVHSTLEAAGGLDVEVWPVDSDTRALGTFYCSCQINLITQEVSECMAYDIATLCVKDRAEIVYWLSGTGSYYANKIGVRVHAQTRAKAAELYTTTFSRAMAGIASQKPPCEWVDEICEKGIWKKAVHK